MHFDAQSMPSPVLANANPKHSCLGFNCGGDGGRQIPFHGCYAAYTSPSWAIRQRLELEWKLDAAHPQQLDRILVVFFEAHSTKPPNCQKMAGGQGKPSYCTNGHTAFFRNSILVGKKENAWSNTQGCQGTAAILTDSSLHGLFGPTSLELQGLAIPANLFWSWCDWRAVEDASTNTSYRMIGTSVVL